MELSPDFMEPADFSYDVGVSAFLPIASAPVPALPPLLSDGFYFFEATDLCSSAGSPMTLFDIDTTSPSRHRCSPLPESSKSQGHCETVSGTSSFSPPLLSADSVPSSPSTTSIDQLPDIETEDKLRVHLDQHIRSTGWFQGGEHEPTVGAPGVPKWAAQLASHGRSIYECFVKTAREKGKPVYKCSSRGCKFKSTRLRRVVGHQRKKRNHKPFVCKAHPNCTFRGHTKDNITDHCSSRNATMNCETCLEPIVKKNMKRHLKDVHSRR